MTAEATEEIMNLAGEWQLELDGVPAGSITLPSTVTESGYGAINEREERQFLTERHTFTGRALYRREFEVKGREGKRVLFSMERSRVTETFVNGVPAGRRDLLTSTQTLDITELVREGRNTIAVAVDNTLEGLPRQAILESHMASVHTQTNWNGIVGRIELRIEPEIYPERIRIEPDAAGRRIRIRIKVFSGREGAARIRLSVRQPQYSRAALAEVEETLTGGSGSYEYLLEGKVDSRTPLWSEFDPQLTFAEVTLETEGTVQHRRIPFGLRDYRVSDDRRHFAVNGQNVFLRSEANCAVFPLTGYAPMEEAAWDRLFDVYKSYGINYVRFHSWCPPEAAFRSADRKGLYLQPELSAWTFHMFEKDADYEYYGREARAILDQYGNHPSLVALTCGNELRSGNRARMSEFCRALRRYDPTRLYAEGSNAWYGEAGVNPDADFVLAQGNYGEKWRGAFAGNQGFINDEPPAEMHTYSEALRGVDKPVISFEVGQFQVYPDYRETAKYTGALEARNLKAYRREMEAKGLAGKDHAFHLASGRLSLACYREEIEAAMRTPELAGISLLGLQDFPGQGTALVGMIDAFGDPKEFAPPEEFRRFCSPVTPLLQFRRKTFYGGEKERLTVLVHNFGAEDLAEPMELTVKDPEGHTVWEQHWPLVQAPQGALSTIAEAELTLPPCGEPETLEATVRIGEWSNGYELYVYPESVLTEEEEARFVESIDSQALARLCAGEDLILLPAADPPAVPESFPASYIPDFWCWYMFRRRDSSGTMGLTMDPENGLLQRFPSADHTDARWWHLLHGSRAAVLTGTGIAPIIGMIDNLQRNETLAMVYGVRVGKGRLLICTFNTENRREPSVAAFVRALAEYAVSADFAPAKSLSVQELRRLVPGTRRAVTDGEAEAEAGYRSKEAGNVLCDDASVWDTAGLSDPGEAWITLRLQEARRVDTLQILFAKSSAYTGEGDPYSLPGEVTAEYLEEDAWRPVQESFRQDLSCSDWNLIHFAPVTTGGIRVRFPRSRKESVNVMAIAEEEKPFAVARIRLF